MIPGIAGQDVALVGRAASLHGSGQGPAIDAAGLVVRVNWVLPVDPSHVPDVGARTDVLYHCFSLCEAAREAAERCGVRAQRLDRLLRQSLARRAGRDPADYQPNTGTVAAFDLLASGARRVEVFGIDHFTSGHVDGQPLFDPDPSEKRFAWDHDPAVDRALLEAAVLEGRVVIHVPDRATETVP